MKTILLPGVIDSSDRGFATFAGPNDAVVPSVVWAKLAALAKGALLATERLWKEGLGWNRFNRAR